MKPHLERAILRELHATWFSLNLNHLRGQLRSPVFALVDTTAWLGRWNRRDRTLSLSRSLVLNGSWTQVVDVLRHEMAHQLADEVLGATDETAHGPAFREGCRRLGVSAAATTALSSSADPAPSKTLERIRKLLALAESDNANEAAAAMRAAQRLLLAHGPVSDAQYVARQLSEVKGRFQAWEKVLAGLLGRHFGVRVVFAHALRVADGKTGRAVEVMGTPDRVDIAEYVYRFLARTGERLWADHRRSRRLRGNQERRRFLLGVMLGFDEKLKANLAQCAAEGLVRVRDGGLEDFVGERYRHLRSGSTIQTHASGAYHHGRAAGRRIELRDPISARPVSRGRQIEG